MCREAFDLISKLLTLNPNKRITASDALQHPFFTNHPECFSSNSLPPKSERSFSIPEKKVELEAGVKPNPTDKSQLYTPSQQLPTANEEETKPMELVTPQ